MAKKLIGKFRDITNQYSYYVKIGNDMSEPFYINDEDDGTAEQVCFSGSEPVVISSDMTDTFEHVYIRNATINLLTNFDIRDIIVAKNYTDIPVEIRKDNNLNMPLSTARDDTNSRIVFTGFVIPLNFNQGYMYEWNEISVECVDRLGILEYIKFPPLLSGNYEYNTPRTFINLCLGQCGVYWNYNILAGQSDNTNDTKINPYIFIGDSEDDWMSCKDVLEEIGKIYGFYCYLNGDTCYLDNILIFNTSGSRSITMDDYMSDDTNISVDTAYNSIKCTADLSEIDETFIDPFKDEYITATTEKGERISTELVYVDKKEKFDNLVMFRNLIEITNSMTNYRNNNNWANSIATPDDNMEVYDTYCQIMKNDLFTFPSPNYLEENQDVLNPSTTGGGNGLSTTDAYKTLRWLYNHPGKGAFLSFGSTQNLMNQSNKQQPRVSDMKKMLLIQVNGPRQTSDWWHCYQGWIPQQISDNEPICEFTMQNSNALIPNDQGHTNYLVINGKIKFNPITPRTGPLGDWSKNYDTGTYNDLAAKNNYDLSSNTIQSVLTFWGQTWTDSHGIAPLVKQRYLMGKTLRYDSYGDSEDDSNKDGKYYQRLTWINTPERGPGYLEYQPWPYNQYADLSSFIAWPFPNVKYEKYKFIGCGYNKNDSIIATDTVPRLPILACELKIGDKYLIEDFTNKDLYKWQIPIGLYNGVYSWRTLENCPDIDDGQGGTIKQTWFTISIDPGIGDYIIGKEFDFADTVTLDMNIKANGFAIPIPYSSGLNGPVSFKILGPYNSVWKSNFQYNIYWNFYGLLSMDLLPNERSILAFVENIQLTDLKFGLYSDSGGSGNTGSSDSDLVYVSNVNDEYIEEKEFDVKFCTSLTDSEARAKGIDYKPNNSAIFNTSDTRWYGMTSYRGYTHQNSSQNKVKLEEARVIDQYNFWKRPRNKVETTLKLEDPAKAYLKNNYTFSYFKYKDNTSQVYRIFGRDIDLKMNTMTCTMKEISDPAE